MADSTGIGGIRPIFESLTYGPALDGENLAKAWLSKHDHQFGYWIDGALQTTKDGKNIEAKNIFKDDFLATVANASSDVINQAVWSSQTAFQLWNDSKPHSQSTILYSIARNVQKHQSLLAVLEAMDTGRLVKATRTVDVPAVIRSFYHYAGWAVLKEEQLKSWKALGVVAIFVDASAPLLQLSTRLAAALAMGNSVILHPSPDAPLSAFLLAEICAQAGLPPGVLNILTGTRPENLASHSDVCGITFTGTRELGRTLRQVSAGQGKKMSMEMQGRNAILILEEADIDSAVEGVLQAAFSSAGQANTCASRLLIQEPVYKTVVARLKGRLAKMTLGNNLDKNTDVGPLVDSAILNSAKAMLAQAEKDGAQIYKACSEPSTGNFLSPTLVTDAQTSSPIYVSELPAPIVVAVPFRTVKEGVAIANHSRYSLNASVWTENISVAMEMAALLSAGTVWVNGQNFQDAAASSGGNKASGFGRMGGREGLLEFARPSYKLKVTTKAVSNAELKSFGGSASPSQLLPDTPTSFGDGHSGSIDKTYKLFYGGGQKRPDSNSYKAVSCPSGEVGAYVPEGGKKDIRNAVDAALKASPGWRKKEGHMKSQILFYMGENLQTRKKEVVSQLTLLTGGIRADADKEFDAAVHRLFYWAAWCDKHGGDVQETPMYGLTVKMNEAVGVIGVVCPEEFPLLAFVSLLAPAIARGNTVVMVTSESFPVSGLAFHEILETSDVPAGVVNIVSGHGDLLAKTLTEHHDVSATWYFRHALGCQFVEHASVENFKRTWVDYGESRNWLTSETGQGEEFLYHCSNSKTVWLPMGDIFAN